MGPKRMPEKNERKLFRKYLTRYLLIVLVVIICCIPFGIKAYQSIREFVLAQNIRELEEGIQALNHNIDKIGVIATVMGENTYVLDLSRIRGEIPGNKHLHMKYIKETLFDTLCLYDFSSMAFFMFRHNQAVITASQVSSDYSDFYGTFLTVDDMLQEEFRDKVFSQLSKSPYLPVERITYYDQGSKILKNDVILYLQTVSVDKSFPDSPAVMIFLFEEQRFVDLLLPGELAENATLTLLDQSGQTILSREQPGEGGIESRQQTNLDASEYQVLHYADAPGGLSITIGYPLAAIYPGLFDIVNLLIAYVIAGGLIAVLLTIVCTMHWYRPFQRILHEVFRLADGEMPKKNEYDYIRESIVKLVSDKDEMETKMLLANNEKRVIMLEKLFMGGFSDPAQKEQFLQEYPLVQEGYYVMQLVIRHFEEVADCQLALLYAMEVLKKESGKSFLHVYPRNNMAIMLVTAENDLQDSDLVEILLTTRDMVVSNYKVLFTAGISQRQSNIEKINVAFAQARQTIHAYETKGESSIEFWKTGYETDKSCFHIDNCHKLYDLLLGGHRDAVQEVFEEMKAENQLNSEKYSFQKHEIYYALEFMMTSVCQQLTIPADISHCYTNAELSNVSLEQCLLRLEKSAHEICDTVIQKKGDKHIELKGRLIQYLKTNFNRQDMTADIASREVNTSEKYVYSFVKEQTGKTFSGYLEELRIDYAKERLRDSDWSNDRIAQAAGFGSVNSFYRAFKKSTGVSPSIFRKNSEP